MKFFPFFILFLFLGEMASISAQEIKPGAVYEARYWQNMAQMGASSVYIDTMVYIGERAGFSYANVNCISFNCKDADSLLYILLPKFSGEKDEYIMGKHIIRKLGQVDIPFRSKSRRIYKVYTTDQLNRNTGIGEYSLICKDFGVICRWNADMEFYQMIRIDVAKDEKILDEIDLLPLFDKIYASDIMTQ